MRTIANWMIVILMVMFWLFRVVVTYMAGIGRDFIAAPLNETVEIVLLFITLLCIVLVIKRKLFGGIIYLISNFAYYGVYLYNSVKPLIRGDQSFFAIGFDTLISIVAVVLSIIVVLDLLADKTKKPDDKKTEWFYKNKDLDRKMDDRADKNQYRTS